MVLETSPRRSWRERARLWLPKAGVAIVAVEAEHADQARQTDSPEVKRS